MTVIRTTKGPEYARLMGLGVARGEVTVTNDDVAGPIDSSDEWIQQRTGIVTRMRAKPETSVLDLAERASRDALIAAGIEGRAIDTVIFSTITHPQMTPAAAPELGARLGCPTAAAFDISAACAGYCYGIAQADALVRSGQSTYVLVVGAEKMSDFVDPTDRSISFLLGDGAGAVVVGPSDAPAIGPTVWGSKDGAEFVRMTHSWLEVRDDPTTPFPTLVQEGQTVFKWASFEMPDAAAKAIEAAGLTPADIQAFIPHQANIRIIDQMAKRIGLPDTVAIGRDIVDSGNTSAASIPLATERLFRDGQVKSGDLALQIGFGAGLVFAAQVVALP
ncbi:MAG: ketoacyl-ACP synthase III [Demequinaceae bacterium]|nr:ketoacyl-ACP synthase III [Demequinaceae bacterium]